MRMDYLRPHFHFTWKTKAKVQQCEQVPLTEQMLDNHFLCSLFSMMCVCFLLLLLLLEGWEKRVEERVWCHLEQYSHPEEIVSKHPKLLQLPSCEANKLRKVPTQEEVKHPCVPIWNSVLTCLRPQERLGHCQHLDVEPGE